MIRTTTEQGTAFSIDHGGNLYLVTARHMVAGLPIVVRTSSQKILFPTSDDVDIAVIKTDEDLPKPYEIAPAGKLGEVPMGQQVWFFGYPFIEGLSSKWSNGEAPFIKRGTMSAIVATNPNAIILYIDGFNNRGFSGGPIVYYDFSNHTYKILGVVKGYKPDAAQTIVNGQPVDTNLLELVA